MSENTNIDKKMSRKWKIWLYISFLPLLIALCFAIYNGINPNGFTYNYFGERTVYGMEAFNFILFSIGIAGLTVCPIFWICAVYQITYIVRLYRLRNDKLTGKPSIILLLLSFFPYYVKAVIVTVSIVNPNSGWRSDAADNWVLAMAILMLPYQIYYFKNKFKKDGK